ncbi:MAG: 50S ribosomal protein L11 methyltransferase [Ignavibacteriales bacterium]|nr:50S ribosomal protein L11 methyltransferase [Ignavibacteriales bacterium]
MKNYKEFKIKAEPFNIDLLSGTLWELDILGINEFDDYLTIFVYEDSEIDSKTIEELLQNLKKENLLNSFSIEVEEIISKNWNEEWEKNVNIIEVSDRIIIKPTFRELTPKKNQIVITIDPKMSFGTGEHQTTKIVLMLLEKYIKNDITVLDLGSGTGVLGIAASKLGAAKIICLDNDEWCYINAKENVEKNDVNNVEVIEGEIEKIDDAKFDLILANINKNILIDVKEKLVGSCNKGGLIILSGLLVSDKEEIERQYSKLGITALEFLQIDEWIGIVFQN